MNNSDTLMLMMMTMVLGKRKDKERKQTFFHSSFIHVAKVRPVSHARWANS